jgi:beta-hydroxylase
VEADGGAEQSSTGGEPGGEPDSFGVRVLRSLLESHQRLIARTAPGAALWPADAIGGLHELEAGWMTVRDEYDQLERDRARLDVEEVAGMQLGVRGRWEAHFLIEQRKQLPAATGRCPDTLALLDGVEGLRCAYFSVMTPDTHLLPHAGPNPSILRVHLTLRTPEPIGSSALVVDGQVVEHRPGELFVFDDTFEHEVWNRGDSDRATLMLDVRRPMPWWVRPIDGAVQLLFKFHPVRRQANQRLVELEEVHNG